MGFRFTLPDSSSQYPILRPLASGGVRRSAVHVASLVRAFMVGQGDGVRLERLKDGRTNAEFSSCQA